MPNDTQQPRISIRYEPNDKPPLAMTVGLGLQFAVLCIAGIVITPAIVVRAAGDSEAFLSWAVFSAVLISGATTVLQARRVGRIGSGHVLLMGTSGAFISVCIAALVAGGPSLLATLVVISALFQFALSARLSTFRRILTPSIGGTVIMLIPVSVMPIVFDMLKDVPEGTSPAAAGLTALATLAVIIPIALRATGTFRLWAPVIGIVAGSVVAGHFGIYDVERVRQAAWVGGPEGPWPGLDLSFGPAFWYLLPGFVFVTLVGAIETIGDAIAIQGVSWRKQRAVDYRVVQGAVTADGVGNLLSGLMGTVPNTTYSTSVSVTELTGVASRAVGVAVGLVFIAFAFLPKVLAIVLAIPGPVAAAYVTVLLAMLFAVGMRIVVNDQIDYRKGLIVGVAFWIGVGFQNQVIFPEFFSEFAGGLLQNGMTAGGLVAMFLTLFSEATQSRSRKIEMPADISALPKISAFLTDFSRHHGWKDSAAERLDAAAEETLLTILHVEKELEDRRLVLTARKQDGRAVLEFLAGFGDENLQDTIALLGDQPTRPDVDQRTSLRLLRHFTSSVRHQQYHNADIVTIHVDVT